MRYDKKVLKKAVVAMTAIVLSVSNPFQAGTTGTMGMARHETARTDLDAKHLFQAHLDAIVGVYHDDADPLPGGGRYIWSERIPDIVMNYAVDIDWTNPNTIRDAAARRGRAPALLTWTDPPNDAPVLARHRAAWMTRRTASDSLPAWPDATVEVTADDPPPAAFLDNFARTETDENVNAHIARYYVAALRMGRTAPNVRTTHVIVRRDAEAVAFASVYCIGQLAGLYNVATRADARRQGLGAAVTTAALHLAAESGAETMFLQCAADSPAEALYRRVGFQVATRPWLVELTPSG